MNTITALSSRGRTWFQALADKPQPVDTGFGSVLVADAPWGGEWVRLLAVVPDPRNRFPRARHGELGLEGFEVAVVKDATAAPRHPQLGDGYNAAVINYGFLANAVLTTDDAVQALQ